MSADWNLIPHWRRNTISSTLQSVIRRIPAGNPFYPYRCDSVVVIKNDDGSISVTDNGEESIFDSVAGAVVHIVNLRNASLDLSGVEEYI